MSQNQIQYQNQRAVRTCSCCGQTGHTITNCTSPQVIRFQEDAAAAAITASSVEVLKLRRPFTNTSLPILKAVAANIRIETSVSNLTVDYLTHLLACCYWNMRNPAGSHANIHDPFRLSQLDEICRQAATNAIREQNEDRVRQERLEAQQQQRQRAAADAERNLQLFLRQQQRYAAEHILIENQRQHTRQAFIQARLPVPQSVAQPFTPAAAAAQAAPLLCLCCNSAEHNINNCKNYRGIPSMFKILALVCTSQEFRKKLQQHPNLYTHLAFAIQSKFVPAECRDCVRAMNEITDYYYNQQEKYVRLRTDLQEYNIEYAYQQETGLALETNVIHDPRFGLYQSIIETSVDIDFTNTNDQDFIAECIRISEMINVNVNSPSIDITLGVKARPPLLTDDAKATAVDADADDDDDEEQSSCAVCLGAWDAKYPTITFGCNHDMCSRCVNTFFKTPSRPSCHLCRQPIRHITVPSEAVNSDLFQGISVRILRTNSTV